MAGDQLNRERRALLGAALGLPLVGSFETGLRLRSVPPQDERVVAGVAEAATAAEEWEAALSAFRAAAEAVAGEERKRAGASFAEAEAGQEAYDLVCEAMEEALLELLGCPAPDVAALAAKLELADAQEV